MIEIVGNSAKESELKNLRKNYSKGELVEDTVGMDPIRLFGQWMSAAQNSPILEPNAMVLSTIYESRPKARVVLLKSFDEQGFVFFTNYQSNKAKEMTANNAAALTFFWDILEKQVRIEGEISKVDEQEAAEYFATRPRSSQIGAWASAQSQVIASREMLETNFKAAEEKFEGLATIPKPDFWGGFRLNPTAIEFWQGRPGRLHDRLLYVLTEAQRWTRERLNP